MFITQPYVFSCFKYNALLSIITKYNNAHNKEETQKEKKATKKNVDMHMP